MLYVHVLSGSRSNDLELLIPKKVDRLSLGCHFFRQLTDFGTVKELYKSADIIGLHRERK